MLRNRFPRLTLLQLWLFLAIGLPVLAALLAPLSTVDLAYQIRAGQLMLDTGQILRSDPFTFTVGGQPWLDQQWGAQVVFAAVYGLAGWAGLAIVRAVLVGLLFAFILAACRAVGAGGRAAALLALASFATAAVALGLRPQLFGMVLFAAVQLLVAIRHQRPGLLWLAPPLVLLWANLHGSFFFGPAILAVAALDDVLSRRSRTWIPAAAAVASALAACLTPFGPAVWGYVVSVSTNTSVRDLITEWQPTSPVSFVGALFYASAIGSALFFATRPRAVGRPWLLWLGALFVLGATAERGVAWWALGAPFVVARALGTFEQRAVTAPAPAQRPSAIGGGIVIALMIVGVLLLPMWRNGDARGGPPSYLIDAPYGVSEAVRTQAGTDARLFVSQGWASWLELAAPNARTFVDSRVELFSDATWDEYRYVVRLLPGWDEVLANQAVTVIALDRTSDGPLAREIAESPGWRVIHDDASGIVALRR